MNAELVLQVFLPYHESPNFARMLSILTIPPTSPYFAPFAPLIKDAQALPRAYIATAISPAKEPSLRLLNDVVGMVPQALREGSVHRAMLNFWSATIVELLEKKSVSEGLVKSVVEAFVGILTTEDGGQDANVSPSN
jgi:U3 small nucleolar RNA-associated protein 10